MSHFKILSLKKDEEIFISDNNISVVCDFQKKETIESDEQFNHAFNKNSFYWISGGGTFLINQRYLVVVQRNSFSINNPGKLSIFTGRAESIKEWEQPSLLKREIFEELLLYEEDQILIPDLALITPVYDNLEKLGIINSKKKKQYTLIKSDRLQKQSIKVNGQSNTINFHINFKTNDVNTLLLFEIDLDIKYLSAEDGELHFVNGNMIRHHRSIYLWDIDTDKLLNITRYQEKNDSQLKALSFEVTGHLQFFINQLKSGMTN